MSKFMMSVLLVILLAAVPSKAAVIYMYPAQQQVLVSDTFAVDVFVTGLNGEFVSGWDLLILFDDNILEATDIFFELANFTDDPLLDAIYDFSISNGSISSFMTSFLTDEELALRQTEPVHLFSISFLALTDGVSLINFGSNPFFELNVLGADGNSLDLAARGACVGVGQGQCATDVPVPATLWLFALAALAPLSQRFRNTSFIG